MWKAAGDWARLDGQQRRGGCGEHGRDRRVTGDRRRRRAALDPSRRLPPAGRAFPRLQAPLAGQTQTRARGHWEVRCRGVVPDRSNRELVGRREGKTRGTLQASKSRAIATSSRVAGNHSTLSPLSENKRRWWITRESNGRSSKSRCSISGSWCGTHRQRRIHAEGKKIGMRGVSHLLDLVKAKPWERERRRRCSINPRCFGRRRQARRCTTSLRCGSQGGTISSGPSAALSASLLRQRTPISCWTGLVFRRSISHRRQGGACGGCGLCGLCGRRSFSPRGLE